MLKKRLFILLWLLTFLGIFEHSAVAKDKNYALIYEVRLLPKKGYAEVSININDASALTSLVFTINPKIHSRLKANGELSLSKTSASWKPPHKNARLQLRSKINHRRKNNKYDALMTQNWAIFRGDDLIPSAHVSAKKGARSVSYLHFELPKGWNSVNTGWARDKQTSLDDNAKNVHRFIIDNPERNFDRPTGWMIAGKIGTRRAWAGNTRISVSAPMNTTFRRMDALTYLNFVWPEMEKAFGPGPKKLLIVGAGDPMWRGGLSASNSLFLHADRPLVSGNGTSTLLHEVIHMHTRISGTKNDDWIAEGLAEFYAIEILYRAGGMDEERRTATYRKLSKWSKDVKNLRQKHSSGEVTAKAVILFSDLNEEIKALTQQTKSIDDLTRALMKERKTSYNAIHKACKKLTGSDCKTLNRAKTSTQT